MALSPIYIGKILTHLIFLYNRHI